MTDRVVVRAFHTTDLRQRRPLKAKAAARGVTVQQVLEEAVEKFLAE